MDSPARVFCSRISKLSQADFVASSATFCDVESINSLSRAINSSAAASSPDGAVRPCALQRQWIFEIRAVCQYDNLFRNNLSHGILAVTQTKEAFASNLKRWMDLR
jgi:hypothetical protein